MILGTEAQSLCRLSEAQRSDAQLGVGVWIWDLEFWWFTVGGGLGW